MKRMFCLLVVATFILSSCKKEKQSSDNNDQYQYYEVGFKSSSTNWRDTAFIVRTTNQQLMAQLEAQLSLPVSNRKLVVGKLKQGSGGYNKNAGHEFKWHFDENDWQLADVTVEIYDGRPYSDIDTDFSYWLTTVKRFGAWSSYIRRKLPGKP